LQSLLDEGKTESLDEILCDPVLAAEFDQFARRLAPGYTTFEYRWAALRLRKEAKKARTRATVLSAPKRFEAMVSLEHLDTEQQPESPGLYLLSESPRSRLYVGETLNLRRRLNLQFDRPQRAEWSRFADSIFIQTLPIVNSNAGMLTWQSCLVRKFKQRPRLNYFELAWAE
jgi:site-specific DNA-methyltransferase (adenine-specific)